VARGCLADERLDIGGAGDVGLEGRNRVGHLRRGFLLGAAHGRGEDLGALTGQPQRRGTPLANPGAGHDRDLPVETRHDHHPRQAPAWTVARPPC
jgi:hypothetical protein